MIHRLLQQVIKTGVAAYAADNDLIDDLFSEVFSLDAGERTAIKAYFAAHTLAVVNGYPRSNQVFPMAAIILAQEGEAEQFLGNYLGMVDEEGNTLYGADFEGSMWEHTFQIPVASEHPDITTYYYELVKKSLLAGLPSLVEEGCYGFKLGGADLAPDPRYIPEHLFVRQLTFTFKRPFFHLDRASRLAKAFRVSGLHVDRSGSPSDVGAVKTNIGVYTDGGADEEE